MKLSPLRKKYGIYDCKGAILLRPEQSTSPNSPKTRTTAVINHVINKASLPRTPQTLHGNRTHPTLTCRVANKLPTTNYNALLGFGRGYAL